VDLELDGLEVTFDHTAVVAPRIRDLLPIYRDLLGGRHLGGGGDNRTSATAPCSSPMRAASA
jgi:methylmalonyl-CoA/ethylmalonyl-CoA epimerase